MEESRTLLLVCLNVALAVLVLVPLLAVLFVLVREVVRRFRDRKRVRWVGVPGIGVLPVLKSGC